MVGVVRADADEVVEFASETGFPFCWRGREEGGQGWGGDGLVHDFVLEPSEAVRVSLVCEVITLRCAVYRSYDSILDGNMCIQEMITHGYSQ